MKNFIALLSVILLNCSALLALDDIIESHLEAFLIREDDGVALMKLLSSCYKGNSNFSQPICETVQKRSQRNWNFLNEQGKFGPRKLDKFLFMLDLPLFSTTQGLSFEDACLVDCSLRGNIFNCSFNGCRFFHTKFESANLINVTFYMAILPKMNWNQCTISKGFFLDANLKENVFSATAMRDSCFNRTHCEKTDFNNINLFQCEFLHAFLSECCFKGGSMEWVDLGGSVLHKILFAPREKNNVSVNGAQFTTWHDFYGGRVTLESIQQFGMIFDENDPPTICP